MDTSRIFINDYVISWYCFFLLDGMFEVPKKVVVMDFQLVTDVNIAVAVEAVQAIGSLASGLRKDFNSGSKLLLPVLLVCSAGFEVFISLTFIFYPRFVFESGCQRQPSPTCSWFCRTN